jgi:hypothetical protein
MVPIGYAGNLVGRELDAPPGAIEDPSQELLAGLPQAIPLPKFFEGDGIFPVMTGDGGRGENRMDSMEDCP